MGLYAPCRLAKPSRGEVPTSRPHPLLSYFFSASNFRAAEFMQ